MNPDQPMSERDFNSIFKTNKTSEGGSGGGTVGSPEGQGGNAIAKKEGEEVVDKTSERTYLTDYVGNVNYQGRRDWENRISGAELRHKFVYAGLEDQGTNLNVGEIRKILTEGNADDPDWAAAKGYWLADVSILGSEYRRVTGDAFKGYVLRQLTGEAKKPAMTGEEKEKQQAEDEFQRFIASDTKRKEILEGILEDERKIIQKEEVPWIPPDQEVVSYVDWEDRKNYEKTRSKGGGAIPIYEKTQEQKEKEFEEKVMSHTAENDEEKEKNFWKTAAEAVGIAFTADEIMEGVEKIRKEGIPEGSNVIRELRKIREEKKNETVEMGFDEANQTIHDKYKIAASPLPTDEKVQKELGAADVVRHEWIKKAKEAGVLNDEMKDQVREMMATMVKDYDYTQTERLGRQTDNPETVWKQKLFALRDARLQNVPDEYKGVVKEWYEGILRNWELERARVKLEREHPGMTKERVERMEKELGYLNWGEVSNESTLAYMRQLAEAGANWDQFEGPQKDLIQKAMEEIAKRKQAAAGPDRRSGSDVGDNEKDEGAFRTMNPTELRAKLVERLQEGMEDGDDIINTRLSAGSEKTLPELTLLRAINGLRRSLTEQKKGSEDLAKFLKVEKGHLVESHMNALWSLEGSQKARIAILKWMGLDLDQMKADGVTSEQIAKREVDIRKYMYTEPDGKGSWRVGKVLWNRDDDPNQPVTIMDIADSTADQRQFWEEARKIVQTNTGLMDERKVNEATVVAVKTLQHSGLFDMITKTTFAPHMLLRSRGYDANRNRWGYCFKTSNYNDLDTAANNELLKATILGDHPDIFEQDQTENGDSKVPYEGLEKQKWMDMFLAPDDVFSPYIFDDLVYGGGLMDTLIYFGEPNHAIALSNFGRPKNPEVRGDSMWENHNKKGKGIGAIEAIQNAEFKGNRKEVKTTWVKEVDAWVLEAAKNACLVGRTAKMPKLYLKAYGYEAAIKMFPDNEEVRAAVGKEGDPYTARIVEQLTTFYTAHHLGLRLEVRDHEVKVAQQGGIPDAQTTIKASVQQDTGFVWSVEAEQLKFGKDIREYLGNLDNFVKLESDYSRAIFELIKSNRGGILDILKAAAVDGQYYWDETVNGIEINQYNEKYFLPYDPPRKGWMKATAALELFCDKRARMKDNPTKFAGGIGLDDEFVCKNIFYDEYENTAVAPKDRPANFKYQNLLNTYRGMMTLRV
jgi:hypothetical protein